MRYQDTSSIQVAEKIAAASVPITFGMFVAASIFCAQANFTALCAAQQAPATYPVSGVVENSLTHQPIARALVDVMSDAVLTDSNGHFELHLPLGFARITARRPGYEGDEFGPNGTTHTVRVGPNTSPLTLYLTPSATITGHVTLSSGDEAGGLQFMLYRKRVVEGHARWMQEGNATTGSDGTFRLLSLGASASYVVCSAPAPDRMSATARGEPVSGYPGVCYPGGADLASATAAPLRLTPGQQAQVEISLARQPFYPVTISVVGGGANGGMPQVFDRIGRPTTFAMRSNQNGSFEFPLPNGSYYTEVRTWGESQLYGRRDFTVAGAPLSGLTLVLAPLGKITVEVHTEFTANPNSGPAIHLGVGGNGSESPPINLNLDPADKPFSGAFGVMLRHAEGSSDSGLYEMEAPPQGAYWTEASGAAYDSYVSSMTSGATDLLREPLVIGAGGRAQPIEITLRNDMGWLKPSRKTPLSGNSVDNSNTEDLSPVLFDCIPLSPNQRRIYQSAIQAPFQATTPLPPGNYLVVAFEKVHEIDLDDPNEMSRLSAQGQAVTVQPGATTEIQLDPASDGGQEASQ